MEGRHGEALRVVWPTEMHGEVLLRCTQQKTDNLVLNNGSTCDAAVHHNSVSMVWPLSQIFFTYLLACMNKQLVVIWIGGAS